MKISVVIAGVSGDRVVDECATSVRRAAGSRDVEVIVLRGDPASVFQLRRRGIAQASGDRIAVLGDRYDVSALWMDAVVENPTAEVEAGCVGPGVSLDYWGWCVYLIEYSHVAPRARGGITNDPKQIPGGNVVYESALVRRLPPDLAETELSFHSRLLQTGAKIVIRPDLTAGFARPPGFSEYIGERFWLSRTIGAMGGMRKLLFAPLLPLVLVFRIAVSVSSRRHYVLRYIACAPAIFLLGVVQAAGEFTGALTGAEE